MNLAPLEQYVNSKVASGVFPTRDEFFLETARVYRELETRHTRLKAQLSERIAEADRGEVEPLDISAIQEELALELNEMGQPK